MFVMHEFDAHVMHDVPVSLKMSYMYHKCYADIPKTYANNH